MKEQVRLFFTALMFYTRLPCPSDIDHSEEGLNKATRYFPLVGCLVGGLCFLVYALTAWLFEPLIGVVFALIAGVWITGAFHEDGLADAFDGFGGGWTREKILTIMKDSRIGAFGAISLILVFLLKFVALQSLLSKVEAWEVQALFFVSYHALARLTAINLVFVSEYARADASSKAKPIAQARGYPEVLGAYVFGLLPLLVLGFYAWPLLGVVLPLGLLVFRAKVYFERWLGGYTGDCLGAVEQLAELICLLSFLVLWKFM